MHRNRGYMLPLDIVFYALYVRFTSLFPPGGDKLLPLLKELKLILI